MFVELREYCGNPWGWGWREIFPRGGIGDGDKEKFGEWSGETISTHSLLC
jgi:hypothetical protein